MGMPWMDVRTVLSWVAHELRNNIVCITKAEFGAGELSLELVQHGPHRSIKSLAHVVDAGYAAPIRVARC